MEKASMLLLVIHLNSLFIYGQVRPDSSNQEDRNLKFDSSDLRIIQRADSILSDSLKWNKQDDRECADDIATGRYSLYCALYKASIDITGEYIHRRAAMQIVRFTLEKYDDGRVKNHRLMDWNNHPATTFSEVKRVLRESLDTVIQELKKR